MKIKDTTKAVRDNPYGFLLDAMTGGTSRAIERMEADGQQQLIESAELPLRLNAFKGDLEKWDIPVERLPDDSDYEKPLARLVYERLGIKVVEGLQDALFTEVEMPEGWRVEATGHSMWSKLIDDKGRERGSIFYKAAFYDRDAFFNVKCRFSIDCYRSADKDGNPVQSGTETHFATYIMDGGKPVQFIALREENDSNQSDEHRNAARQWLNENYPEWENPFAYWEL